MAGALGLAIAAFLYSPTRDSCQRPFRVGEGPGAVSFGMLLVATIIGGSAAIHYSVVTRAVLFAGCLATEVVGVLFAPFRELDVGRPIAERAGRLRRESGVRLPDALIAATAVEHHRRKPEGTPSD